MIEVRATVAKAVANINKMSPADGAYAATELVAGVAMAISDQSLIQGATLGAAQVRELLAWRNGLSKAGRVPTKRQERQADADFSEVRTGLLTALQFSLGMIGGDIAAEAIEASQPQRPTLTVLQGGQP